MLEFVCECADARCIELLKLTLDEYGRVPRTGNYFLVKPGHEQRRQRVVVRTAHYVVVENHSTEGERAEMAAATLQP